MLKREANTSDDQNRQERKNTDDDDSTSEYIDILSMLNDVLDNENVPPSHIGKTLLEQVNTGYAYDSSSTNSPTHVEIMLGQNDSSDEEQSDSSESEAYSDFESDLEDMFDILIQNHPPPLPYPHNPLANGECNICFVNNKVRSRMCCCFQVCDDCMDMYLSTQVSQAIVKIECLNNECNNYVHRDEILARLPLDLKEKYYKFLIDANKDPKVKTCPRCTQVMRLDDYLQKMSENGLVKQTKRYKKYLKRDKKKSIEVTCEKCGLEWCFQCQAPVHKGLSCKTFKKGDQLVKTWASEFHYGQQNAQRCPKCKIFIQRTTGCDHMVCISCKTSFCYRCGHQYFSVKFLGDHFSRYSPFGCRYNLLPDRPKTRRLVRGAVFSGKILGGIVLGGVAVAAGAGLLGISVIALPVIGGYYLRKKYWKQYMENKRNQRIIKQKRNMDKNGPTQSSVESPAVEETASNATTFPEWLVVGVQLPNSQQVEVLVHRSVSSNEAEQDHVYKTEITHHDDGMVQDGGIVTVTEVEEVRNEDGSTRVIAHIITKPANQDMVKQDKDGGSEGHGGHARKDSRISIEGKCLKVESEKKCLKVESEKKCLKVESEKKCLKVESEKKCLSADSDKKTGNAELNAAGDDDDDDDDDDVVAMSFEKEMTERIGDEAGTNETNGCFVNIFAKRLNSFHSATIPDALDAKPPKTLLKSKSGTWEKSKKKEAHYTNSLDLRSLSAIMAAHCSEREVKGQKWKHSGMLDNLEAAETGGGSGCEDGGKDADVADADLSCDIVTYL